MRKDKYSRDILWSRRVEKKPLDRHRMVAETSYLILNPREQHDTAVLLYFIQYTVKSLKLLN